MGRGLAAATNGWAIGGRETNPDEGAQDWADAQDLYRILEEEIVPRYYERGEDGLPHGWLARMRESIAAAHVAFSIDAHARGVRGPPLSPGRCRGAGCTGHGR